MSSLTNIATTVTYHESMRDIVQDTNYMVALVQYDVGMTPDTVHVSLRPTTDTDETVGVKDGDLTSASAAEVDVSGAGGQNAVLIVDRQAAVGGDEPFLAVYLHQPSGSGLAPLNGTYNLVIVEEDGTDVYKDVSGDSSNTTLQVSETLLVRFKATDDESTAATATAQDFVNYSASVAGTPESSAVVLGYFWVSLGVHVEGLAAGYRAFVHELDTDGATDVLELVYIEEENSQKKFKLQIQSGATAVETYSGRFHLVFQDTVGTSINVRNNSLQFWPRPEFGLLEYAGDLEFDSKQAFLSPTSDTDMFRVVRTSPPVSAAPYIGTAVDMRGSLTFNQESALTGLSVGGSSAYVGYQHIGHSVVAGDIVTISGFANADYNGTFECFALDSGDASLFYLQHIGSAEVVPYSGLEAASVNTTYSVNGGGQRWARTR